MEMKKRKENCYGYFYCIHPEGYTSEQKDEEFCHSSSFLSVGIFHFISLFRKHPEGVLFSLWEKRIANSVIS